MGDENEEGEDEENEMISQMWSQMKEEALKKMNDESGEVKDNILLQLCFSQFGLKTCVPFFYRKYCVYRTLI